MFTYHDHQIRAADNVVELYRSGTKRIVNVCPTGGGKTVTMKLIKDRIEHKKAFCISHTTMLKEQLNRTLCETDTVQSLLNREPDLECDLLFLDEAHHYVADKWQEIETKFPNAKLLLGSTATPVRSDGIGLGRFFDDMVDVVKHSELIKIGMLVPAKIKSKSPPKGSTHVLVFCKTIKEAKLLHNKSPGSALIVGSTKLEDRNDIVNDFKKGNVTTIFSVMTMVEGIDIPETQHVVLRRRFGDVSTYLQTVGRGLRAHPGKTHLDLYDLCGNLERFGLPDQDRVWSLDDDLEKIEQLEKTKLFFIKKYSKKRKFQQSGFNNKQKNRLRNILNKI